MFKFLKKFLGVFAAIFVIFFLIGLGSLMGRMDPMSARVDQQSILLLELDGIILDGKELLENIRKYSTNENIKGVLLRINSPGGVVGPSQEIYSEIKRVREELQKPVVVSANAVAASGAYYAAVAADQIITNPGTMMGSIGVIMEFANLEDLYNWAKIHRYSIKTGPFKDSGADYRRMTPVERELFQDMIDEVHLQFKSAVALNRKLSMDIVDKYADGRIFTGETAVKLGFADQLGTLEDALRIVGELSGLGAEPKLFKPPKKRPDFFEILAETRTKAVDQVENLANSYLRLKTLGQPLLIVPGTLGF